MALHKGFYYFHVIHFWSLFALFPFLFQKLKKNALIFEKSRVSSIKVSEIFPLEPFFRVLQIKCLWKCSYFKKPPQGSCTGRFMVTRLMLTNQIPANV